jgi:hypothetical protein
VTEVAGSTALQYGSRIMTANLWIDPPGGRTTTPAAAAAAVGGGPASAAAAKGEFRQRLSHEGAVESPELGRTPELWHHNQGGTVLGHDPYRYVFIILLYPPPQK